MSKTSQVSSAYSCDHSSASEGATDAIPTCDGSLLTVGRARTASLLVLKMRVPLVATKETTGCPLRTPKGVTSVKHLEQSGELCGWAVVENRAEWEELLEAIDDDWSVSGSQSP